MQSFRHFIDFVKYLWFWSLPFLATFVVMAMLLYAPINILNLTQMLLIAYTLGSHIKLLDKK
jgi:hypothetical protein